jgi:hypothetical protein
MTFFFLASACSIQAFAREAASSVLADADLVEGVHDGFVGAAVQRALESANCRGDCRMQVRQGEVTTRAVNVEALKECSA